MNAAMDARFLCWALRSLEQTRHLLTLVTVSTSAGLNETNYADSPLVITVIVRNLVGSYANH